MEVVHNTVVNYNSDHDFADYVIIFSLIKVRTKHQSDKNKLPRYQYNHAFVKWKPMLLHSNLLIHVLRQSPYSYVTLERIEAGRSWRTVASV